ncbi:MAG: hypothetical protein QM784_25960 [Polyangiaceae bacterium]
MPRPIGTTGALGAQIASVIDGHRRDREATRVEVRARLLSNLQTAPRWNEGAARWGWALAAVAILTMSSAWFFRQRFSPLAFTAAGFERPLARVDSRAPEEFPSASILGWYVDRGTTDVAGTRGRHF